MDLQGERRKIQASFQGLAHESGESCESCESCGFCESCESCESCDVSKRYAGLGTYLARINRARLAYSARLSATLVNPHVIPLRYVVGSIREALGGSTSDENSDILARTASLSLSHNNNSHPSRA